MRLVLSMIVSLFMLVMASAAVAQWHSYTVHGTVRATTGGALLPNVRVQLQSLGLTLQEMVPRDRNFEFRNVEEGRYILLVEAPGYETVREEIDVPGLQPVIDLHPLRKGIQQPAEGVSVWALRIPPSARRQFEAAKSNLLRNNCVGALKHLKKAIHAYAQYGDAHNFMGQCYAVMSEFEAAEQEFKLALEQPHKPELHVQLGKVYYREGKQSLIAHQIDLYTEEKANEQGDPKLSMR
jgi:tetratricopeptide (TPR) repeat protein